MRRAASETCSARTVCSAARPEVAGSIMRPIRVGLLGIGTVGGGTWDVLSRNADEIQRRAGRAIKITQVADKALHRAKKITGKKAKVVGDAFKLVRDAQIDIVVELLGGSRIARALVLG